MPDSYDKPRAFLAEALEERQRGDVPDYLRPSAYWLDFCKYSQYVRKLPAEELENIRYHTWHLTADNYQRYYFATELMREGVLAEYQFLRTRLPKGGVFAEAATDIGFSTDYGPISVDLLRYMLVLVDLYENRCLFAERHQAVLEIGGGYGGLAALCMTLNPRISYVAIDLEETLFYQAVYLQNRFGAESVALYDFEHDCVPEIRPGRFHLIPQAKSDKVRSLQFDLAINQQSMQEMNARQVEHYCDLLSEITVRFYSSNFPHHDPRIRQDKGTVENLTDYLTGRFPVVWKSAQDLGKVSQLTWQLLPSIVGQSRMVARTYEKLTGKPMRRFSDPSQRLLLAPSGPKDARAKTTV